LKAPNQPERVVLKSEIRSIRTVRRSGPPLGPTASALVVYGRRPDNRTCECQVQIRPDGAVVVSSTWKAPDAGGGNVRPCLTEFTGAEWAELCRVPENLSPYVCNRILDKRKTNDDAKRVRTRQ
jgi:hypothetical protein